MTGLKRTIGALAFTAMLALMLAAATSDAYAAHVDADAHGAIVDKGPGSGSGTGPFLATGLTWE